MTPPDIRPAVVALVAAGVVLVAGCGGPAFGSGESPDGTPRSTPTDTPLGDQRTPSSTPAGTMNGDVAVASEFTRVEVGDTARLNYRGQNVTVSYSREDGTSRIEVATDEHRKTITRESSTTAQTVTWSGAGLTFVLKPVETEQRDGQTVYVLGEAWNTSFVELKVFCSSGC